MFKSSFLKAALSLSCIFCCSCMLFGCTGSLEQPKKGSYVSISSQQAKQLMETEENYIILDVRTQEEYDEKHIKGATLIPDTKISSLAETLLKDKEQLILVYCRTGRRSKNASAELAAMGYTNVKEFGGIVDWPYETE